MRRLRALVFAAGVAVPGTGCAQAAPAKTTTAMPSTTPLDTSAAAAGAAVPAVQAVGSWGGRSRCPAWRPWTGASTAASCRCRAARRATGGPVTHWDEGKTKCL
jgi:hypothetical protein